VQGAGEGKLSSWGNESHTGQDLCMGSKTSASSWENSEILIENIRFRKAFENVGFRKMVENVGSGILTSQ